MSDEDTKRQTFFVHLTICPVRGHHTTTWTNDTKSAISTAQHILCNSVIQNPW